MSLCIEDDTNSDNDIILIEPSSLLEKEYSKMDLDFQLRPQRISLCNFIYNQLYDIILRAYYPPKIHNQTLFSKLYFWTIGANLRLILKLSIPPFSERKWNKMLAVIFPLLGFPLILTQMRITNILAWEITIGISILSLIWIWFFTESKIAPKFIMIFMIIAFFQSIQWIWFLCTISVDIFKLFVDVYEIQPAYMGITFMCMTNSIGDILANLAMVRLGYPVMALTAAFAGPIFNIMIGVGFTMTRNILRNKGPMEFSYKEILNPHNENMLIIAGLIIGSIVLSVFMIIVSKNKFMMTKKIAMVNIGGYAVLFIILSFLSAHMN